MWIITFQNFIQIQKMTWTLNTYIDYSIYLKEIHLTCFELKHDQLTFYSLTNLSDKEIYILYFLQFEDMNQVNH